MHLCVSNSKALSHQHTDTVSRRSSRLLPSLLSPFWEWVPPWHNDPPPDWRHVTPCSFLRQLRLPSSVPSKGRSDSQAIVTIANPPIKHNHFEAPLQSPVGFHLHPSWQTQDFYLNGVVYKQVMRLNNKNESLKSYQKGLLKSTSTCLVLEFWWTNGVGGKEICCGSTLQTYTEEVYI